jgi:hypothetical protein
MAQKTRPRSSSLIKEMVSISVFEQRSGEEGWLILGIVLSHIISQLRPGADLSRVVLPTFILEPRSMLERITKCVYTSEGVMGIREN